MARTKRAREICQLIAKMEPGRPFRTVQVLDAAPAGINRDVLVKSICYRLSEMCKNKQLTRIGTVTKFGRGRYIYTKKQRAAFMKEHGIVDAPPPGAALKDDVTDALKAARATRRLTPRDRVVAGQHALQARIEAIVEDRIEAMMPQLVERIAAEMLG